MTPEELKQTVVDFVKKHPLGVAGTGLAAAGGGAALSGYKGLGAVLAGLGLGGVGADIADYTPEDIAAGGAAAIEKLRELLGGEPEQSLVDVMRRRRILEGLQSDPTGGGPPYPGPNAWLSGIGGVTGTAALALALRKLLTSRALAAGRKLLTYQALAAAR